MKNKCVAVIVSLIVVAAMGATPALASDTTFSGRAYVAQANVLGQQVTLEDTGQLDPTGGQKEASLLSESVPGLLTAQVFHASTVGQGNYSRAEASVADLNLTVPGSIIGAPSSTIGAKFLMARAAATCSNGQPSASGSSELAELVINGQTIDVGTPPNTTINLPGGGQVIINEQTSNPPGNPGDITVNALHVIVPGVADVVIASAHADITCGRPPCESSKDFVTGGGWILVNGSKANFAVAGGIKNGYWGHLQYIDHVSDMTDMKVKGTGVTMYMIVPNSIMRHIEGDCEIDGAPGKYVVDVSDIAEPGGDDLFRLQLPSKGYDTGLVTLAGGNIQLHSPCN